MRLLILGGTRFVGRHTAAAALARGHQVTLLHRGRSAPGLFPEAEHLIGDRHGDLAALRGRTWDAVIDPAAYHPDDVTAVLAALGAAPPPYLLVSTISVYADPTKPIDERSPVVPSAPPDASRDDLASYGGRKIAAEAALAAALPAERRLIVRPGLIVGPHDYDDRFPWWLRRVAAPARPLIAPGDPEAPVQLLDVRDLAAWLIDAVEQGRTGLFNAVGPATHLSMTAFLDTLVTTLGAARELVWVSDEVLVAQQVRPFAELPFWGPAQLAGACRVDASSARAAGLAFRPLADTVRDTWAWIERDWEREAPVRALAFARPPAGLTAERERAILDALTPAV
jgi:2'-hydroxyisoflavone reductase